METCEELWVTILNPRASNFIISVIYRHPCPNDLNQFKDKFENIILELNKTNNNFFILGDMNLNLLNHTHNDFINSLEILGCKQLVSFITHPNPLHDSLIDHIYTNCDNYITNTYFLNEDISDHFPIILTLDKFFQRNSNTERITFRDMKSFSPEDFNNHLAEELHIFKENELESMDVNQSFIKFNKIFQSSIDKHAPLVTLSKKRSKIKYEPWISKGLIKSLKTKSALFKGYLESRNQVAYHIYKNYKNKLNHIIRKAKKQYYDKLMKSSTNNSKSHQTSINNTFKFDLQFDAIVD